MLEQPGLLNFENLRSWRFHSPSATLLGSSTFTGISLFLKTSMNVSCYPFWVLLLALFLCHLHLAPSPLHPPIRGLKNTIQFPSVFSCPGGSRADLSTPSACMPHSQEKCTAASPIMLTASILVGPLCWPSGLGTSCLSYTMSHGKVSAKQLSSLITTTHPSPAPRNASVTARSQWQSTGLCSVWAGQELPSKPRLGAQAETLQLALLEADLQPG